MTIGLLLVPLSAADHTRPFHAGCPHSGSLTDEFSRIFPPGLTNKTGVPMVYIGTPMVAGARLELATFGPGPMESGR